MQRLYKWDNIKAFLILCVVLGHFASIAITNTGSNSLFNFTFFFTLSFHMPLFVFVSGLFTKPFTDQKGLNKERILGFVLLGFAYKFLNTVTRCLAGWPIAFSVTGDSGAPWYMFAMAAFMILTYLLRNTKPAIVLTFSVVIALLTGYDASIGPEFYLSRIVTFFPFYYIGYCLKPEQVTAVLSQKWWKVTIAIIGLVIACILIYQNTGLLYSYKSIGTGNRPYHSVRARTGHCEWYTRASFYVVAALISSFVIAVMPNKKIPVVSTLGTRTLQIYILHRPILTLLQASPVYPWVQQTFGYYWSIAWLALGVILTLLLSLRWVEYPFAALLRSNKKTQ